jgi:CheY-like chemotaxis protein
MEATNTGARRVLLIVGRNSENRHIIDDAIRHWKFESVVSHSFQESLELLGRQEFILVFCEERADDVAYRDFLGRARKSKIPVVVISALSGRDEVFRESLALGAVDILPSPCSKQDVQWMLISVTQRKPIIRRTDAIA